jgi:putative oxidoreductase
VDFFTLESGVYAQMFPKAFEAAGYDPSALGFGYTVIAWLGTYAEWALPLMIVIGIFTRLAALGMIGFVVVQTWVDVTGHGAALGTLFDKGYGLADERLLWIFLLGILVVRGAGPLSVDHGLGRAVGRYWDRDALA